MNKVERIFVQVGSIFLIGILSIWLASYLSGKIGSEKTKEDIVKEAVNEVIVKRPICPRTSESFVALRTSGQTVTLVENLNSYAESGVFAKSKTINVNTGGTGSQVACGYLYVRSHTSNGPLHEDWGERPYIKPGEFGGHIIANNWIANNNIQEKTELIFDLSKINYKETLSSTEIRTADWVALLNVSDRIRFDLALNTTDKAGMLDEVVIVYKCWNPETGKETTDCRLTVN